MRAAAAVAAQKVQEVELMRPTLLEKIPGGPGCTHPAERNMLHIVAAAVAAIP